ncbi:kunitz-type serine protease inhibitor 2-like [Drosophila madeirensis]|uniref:Kunitz-type serine protease inhibitor 2-like n=1 Tax=Drosophila madeirensis TaxID=30013 RepID=A0AAU9EYG7_DROMD
MFWRRLTLAILAASLVYANIEEITPEKIVKMETYVRSAICSKSPSYGSCKGRRVMWYYNYHRSKCEHFLYSNCGGNPNRFPKYAECVKFCR